MIRRAERIGQGKLTVSVWTHHVPALSALCMRFGWEMQEIDAGLAVRALRFAKRRMMLFAGLVLCIAAVFVSSQMVLWVSIEHAGEYEAEVRRFLAEENVRPGRLKSAFSTDALREQLSLRLPGLAFVSLRFEGSVLVVDCRGARTGEQIAVDGEGLDIVAARDGIVTTIYASSGTPQVHPGEAVQKGQVLILGQERTRRGEMRAVLAQGEVKARVWAKGEAKVSLYETRTVETGAIRTRVTLHSPWHTHVVRDAQPFDSQDVSTAIEPVVGLYLPLYREITTYAQTVVSRTPRNRGDAASLAQGAAQEIAKKQCPYGALILDNWVNYSMIDNEFLYATVILEYETSIAGRLK